MTKFKGNFSYFLNGEKLKDYEEFIEKTKDIEISTSILNLEVRAKTVKNEKLGN